MRPKPTREWVMLELERLNVRVVSGRAVKDDEYAAEESMGRMQNAPNCADPNLVGRRGSITASLLNAADIARASGNEWSADSGVNNFNSSSIQSRNNSLSDSIMGEMSKKEDNVPPHRPLVGGGSAAAYEAARAEHYRELAEKKNKDSGTGSSSGMENGIMSNAIGVMQNGLNSGMQQGLGGPSINANQHYEMLKLHHMNLLNEIQETTLMMNIYQQQQLQQQQQHQMQQQQLKEQHEQMQQIQNSQYGSSGSHIGMPDHHGSNSSKNSSQSKQKKRNKVESNDQPTTITNNASSDDGDKSTTREDKLAKIKAEIEERKRMLEELVNGDDAGGNSSKRSKTAV